MARTRKMDTFSTIKDAQERHRARRYSELRCYADGKPLDLKKDGKTFYRLCKDCREKRKAYAIKKRIGVV